jgi:hypothetical protein
LAFLTLAAGFWGHPGIAAEFAMADDANGSMAAPATEALPNQSMSLVRPAPGVASHPEDHGDRRDRRGGHPALDIERSDPRLVGPTRRGRWRTARELEDKMAARPDRRASSPCRAILRHSNRSTPKMPKNKTLRDRAFREISYRKNKPQKKHKR